MATIAVQVKIGDYSKWREVFDKYKSARDKAGLTNAQVYRNADRPDEILTWFETTDVAKAREGLMGSEIKKGMQEAGVIGPPKVHVIP
jgi:erythromycin esterase-like protein